VTQSPSEFIVELNDDVSNTEFIALTNSVIDYLKTIPERTQLASEYPGSEPFLTIRSKGYQDYSRDFIRRYPAISTFMLEIEDDVRGDRAHFWVNVHAAIRRAREEGQGDIQAEAVETVSFVTRHELGLYKCEQ
jgi:hypothetical protein